MGKMRPHIIVFGNEKGGTGKSTLAMHLSVYLLNSGYKVTTVDLDARQGTFSRYFENRRNSEYKLDLPDHKAIFLDDDPNRLEAEKNETKELMDVLNGSRGSHFVVIDTPGTNTHLSRLAHSCADTLVTPINDSFIDLDMLVLLNSNDLSIVKPSTYSEMVWQQRIERAKKRLKPTDWLVVRNRLSTLVTKNKREINDVLATLSKRIGFRLGNGFCERVIFKELFLQGITLLDFETTGQSMTISHVSARQELRDFVKLLNLPQLALPPKPL